LIAFGVTGQTYRHFISFGTFGPFSKHLFDTIIKLWLHNPPGTLRAGRPEPIIAAKPLQSPALKRNYYLRIRENVIAHPATNKLT